MGGDFTAFYPDGLAEAPYDMVIAVGEALTVLSWYENLPENEQPPRHIWWSGDLLDAWFRNVRENRNRESGKHRSSYDSAEDVPMTGNELARELRPRG